MIRGHGTEADLAALIAPHARSPELVLVVARDGRVVARNPAAVAHAETSEELAAQVVPDAAAQLQEAVHNAIATRAARSFEWGQRGPAGVRAWYAALVVPVELGGEVAGVIVSSRPITELKVSEERTRRSEQLLVDTQGVAHLGTWEWDVAEPLATWSAELYKMYELTPQTYTPSYEAYLTKVHPEDRQRVIDATNRVFHEHVPYSHDERILLPDGSIRFLHTWAYPVLDPAGKLVRLVGVCQDITDRKLAEAALQELNVELERRVEERTRHLEAALRDLESFNSLVSHDVRAPLSVIQMAAELIEREPGVPERAKQMTERIRHAVGNMAALARDLLSFARVGEAALRPVELDVSALSAELVTERQHATPERMCEVVIEPGLRAHADPTLLRIVLGNLIDNAWKYTETVPAARIEIAETTRAGTRAIVVRDNGIGFDMAEHDQLFRPFSRLSNASSFRGSGIGLAAVQRIVERHGGRIDAEAAVGAGATFYVTLPA